MLFIRLQTKYHLTHDDAGEDEDEVLRTRVWMGQGSMPVVLSTMREEDGCTTDVCHGKRVIRHFNHLNGSVLRYPVDGSLYFTSVLSRSMQKRDQRIMLLDFGQPLRNKAVDCWVKKKLSWFDFENAIGVKIDLV